VNNYFILFYIAYLRQIEFRGVKKQCDQSCLGELQLQMLIVFTGKTFGLQFVELAKPFVAHKIDLFLETQSTSSVNNVAKKMVAGVKNVEENMVSAGSTVVHGAADVVNKGVGVVAHVVLDDASLNELGYTEDSKEHAETRAQLLAKQNARQSASTTQITDPYELQTHMVNYEEGGTFDDFNEMAIQYGYIALFSPCMTLAPFFALLNNVFEIRGDAWKLCKGYQRPTAKRREDIGSWFTVLNFLGFVAVPYLTPGVLHCCVCVVLPSDNLSDSYVGLSFFLVFSHMDTGTAGVQVMTNATMIAFVGSQAAKTEEERSGIQQRFGSAHLWTQAVGIEHGVMLCRVFLLVFLPTYPDWINDAKEVLRFRVSGSS
jgi:hypothetical protein